MVCRSTSLKSELNLILFRGFSCFSRRVPNLNGSIFFLSCCKEEVENRLCITPFIDLAIFKILYNNESNYKLDCQILGDMLSIFELEIK